MAQSSPGENFYFPVTNPHPQNDGPDELDLVLSMLIEDAARSNNLHRRQSKRDNPAQVRRRRRNRTTFTTEQIAELEEDFLQNHYLTTARLAQLSAKLILRPTQIQIWFKNRRRRQKLQAQQEYFYEIMEPSPPSASVSPPLSDDTTTSMSAPSPNPINESENAVIFTDTASMPEFPTDPVVVSDTVAATATEPEQPLSDILSSEIVAAATSVLLNENICLDGPVDENDIDADTLNLIESTLLSLNNGIDPSNGNTNVPIASNASSLQQYSADSQYCSVDTNAPTTTSAYCDAHIIPNGVAQIPDTIMSPTTTQFQVLPLEQDTTALITSEPYCQSSQYEFKQQNSQIDNFCKIGIDHNYNHSYYVSSSIVNQQQQQQEELLGADNSKSMESTVLPPFDDLFKPRTPRSDGNSSFSSGSGSNSTDSDDLDSHVRSSINTFVLSNDVVGNTIRANKRSRDDYGSHSMGGAVAMLDQNTGAAYTKYRKLADTAEPNYLCTMDNFMHSYASHPNVTNTSQQFAYCLN